MITKSLPTTADLIKKYQLNAKKSLGQNFILNPTLTDKIADSAGNLEKYDVLEIGSGPGGLTCSILRKNPHKLTIIEKDQRFLPLLNEIAEYYPNRLNIVTGDALQIDENILINNKPFKIIANLPYNIGTELIFKWLKNYRNISEMVLLLQKEVAERIVAIPGSRKYGRLSVMVNFLCHSQYLFDVSPKAFTPSPKVTSAVIKITPRSSPLMDVEIDKLEKICRMAFGQKRKMIRGALKNLGSQLENLFLKSGINPQYRAEQLTIEQLALLAKYAEI